MKYMLDTNTCILAQKQDPAVLEHIKECWEDGIAISAITLAELQRAVEESSHKERNTAALLKFLSIVDIMPFDSNAAMEYGAVCSELNKISSELSLSDMMIAAHARSENMILVTDNVRDFGIIENILLEEWSI